jgi:hypothetical protein
MIHLCRVNFLKKKQIHFMVLFDSFQLAKGTICRVMFALYTRHGELPSLCFF